MSYARVGNSCWMTLRPNQPLWFTTCQIITNTLKTWLKLQASCNSVALVLCWNHWEGSKIITPPKPLKPAFHSRSPAELIACFVITFFILKLKPERSGSYFCRSFWIFCSSFHSQFPQFWYLPRLSPYPMTTGTSWPNSASWSTALYNQPHHQPYIWLVVMPRCFCL